MFANCTSSSSVALRGFKKMLLNSRIFNFVLLLKNLSLRWPLSLPHNPTSLQGLQFKPVISAKSCIPNFISFLPKLNHNSLSPLPFTRRCMSSFISCQWKLPNGISSMCLKHPDLSRSIICGLFENLFFNSSTFSSFE